MKQGIIKFGDETSTISILPFSQTARTEREEEVTEVSKMASERDALAQGLADAHARIALFPVELDKARKEARAEGRLEAELEFVDDRQAALDRLESGLQVLGEKVDANFLRWDALAVLIMTEAFEKLLGERDIFRAMAIEAIRHQISLLGSKAVIGVDVSRMDFANTAEIDELVDALADDRIVVKAVSTLEAGATTLKLTLGSMEIGLGEQWMHLKSVLTDCCADMQAP